MKLIIVKILFFGLILADQSLRKKLFKKLSIQEPTLCSATDKFARRSEMEKTLRI